MYGSRRFCPDVLSSLWPMVSAPGARTEQAFHSLGAMRVAMRVDLVLVAVVAMRSDARCVAEGAMSTRLKHVVR